MWSFRWPSAIFRSTHVNIPYSICLYCVHEELTNKLFLQIYRKNSSIYCINHSRSPFLLMMQNKFSVRGVRDSLDIWFALSCQLTLILLDKPSPLYLVRLLAWLNIMSCSLFLLRICSSIKPAILYQKFLDCSVDSLQHYIPDFWQAV